MSGHDEYKVVTRRKRSTKFRGQVRTLAEVGRIVPQEEPEIDVERVGRGVLGAVRLIEESGYGNILLNGLDEALRSIEASDITEIICYGLGNFSQSRASKFQLAAILTIKSRYKSTVRAYDPLFFDQEIGILKEFGIGTIEKNEEAKRTIQETSTSLIYLPHCPYQLTNNLIYANWSPRHLANCIVLSNSFGELVDSIFTKDLESSENYIARIYPYTTEIELKNSFEHEEVFNGRTAKMRENMRLIRSLVREIRRTASDKKNLTNDNIMVRYIMEQARAHRDTSEVLCKAREELKHLAETYTCYLGSQRLHHQIRSEYAGAGERTVRETADLVGFKLPHDPK